MSAGHGGQILVSASTRSALGDRSIGDLIFRDLGDHRLKDLSGPQRLFQVGDDEFPPLKSLYRTNLPVPSTPFLGRERELQEITALLASDDVRLVSLTGPGGTGKTRLAAQAAADVAELYPDGVFWVGLASLTDSSLVSSAVVNALDTNEELASHLSSKRLLLLLDNFEHVLPAASELGGLLARCPDLNLLVTSREPTHVSGEREYAVPPLRESDAVSLFQERARAAGIEVEADEVVADICRMADFLPLAIELASARVRILSPPALRERLEQRLTLLTGGARDLPGRQQTLRATIQWSYDLLTLDEQKLFARLAVFAGGWSLDAAEGVSGAELDALQSLVEKSLVRHGYGRFRMLETIREYAGERLNASDEAADLKQRHAAFFVALAETGHPHLRGPDAPDWNRRFDEEQDNFRAALEFLVVDGDGDNALALAATLARYWFTRGQLDEGRRWLERTLSESPSAPARSRGLVALALIALEQDDLDTAAVASVEALELDRSSGDDARIVDSTLAVADVMASSGDLVSAAREWSDAAERARGAGLGLETGIALYNLAHVARHEGKPEIAEVRFEQALAAFREIEDVRGQAGALFGLVQMAAEREAIARALSLLHTATELMVQSGYVAGVLDAVELYVGLLESGDPEAAATLSGARYTLNEGLGRQHAHPLEVAAHDETLAGVRVALGDELFEAAWGRGALMTLDEAVAFAFARSSAVAEGVWPTKKGGP
jgi:predicted ATPase